MFDSSGQIVDQFWDIFLELPGHLKGSRGSFFERRVPFVACQVPGRSKKSQADLKKIQAGEGHQFWGL